MHTTENLIVILIFTVFLCVGAGILFHEVVQNRCRNYATTAFQGAFVLLFIAIPIAIHIVFDGAQSIVSGVDSVHTDLSLYLVYAACVAAVLIGQIIVNMRQPTWDVRVPLQTGPPKALQLRLWLHCVVLGAGWFLYVRATGMGLAELIGASRFAWFGTDSHILVAGVVADYLIAFIPVFFFCALAYGKQKRVVLLVGLLIVIGYGLCSKDRKWIIYLTSGTVAAYYVRSNAYIILRPAALLSGLVVAGVLAFWQVARDTLFTYALGEKAEFWNEAGDMAARLLRSGDGPYYYQASMEAISQTVDHDFFIPFGLVRRQIFFFVPSAYSLGLKPDDIPALFSDIVYGGNAQRRGNMPPGFFGLFLVSFKWYLTPIFLLFFPFLLRIIDRFILHERGVSRDILLATLLSSVILLLRGDDAGATYFILSNMILGVGINFLCTVFQRGSGRPSYQSAGGGGNTTKKPAV